MRVSSRRSEAILRFHNRIFYGENIKDYLECTLDIPDRLFKFYQLFSHEELVYPFVRETLVDKNLSEKRIEIMYGISRRNIRTISSNLGI